MGYFSSFFEWWGGILASLRGDAAGVFYGTSSRQFLWGGILASMSGAAAGVFQGTLPQRIFKGI
jgi:hypothetical protein